MSENLAVGEYRVVAVIPSGVDPKWLAEHDRQEREKTWFETLNAIAWCVENGATSHADAIEYVAKHNPHAAPLSNVVRPGGE